MSTAIPAVPVEASHWSAAYWEAAAEGRLVTQWCDACQISIMYPKLMCPVCYSRELVWRESVGIGEVYSFTVQELGAPSGFEDMLPYVLAIIRLDEGAQLLSNVVGDDALEVACGDRVAVAFHRRGDRVLPVFERVSSV